MEKSEPVFTTGEASRLAALLARGAYLVHRGKSTAEIERQIDALKAAARQRVALEAAARKAAADKRRQEHAEKRAARKGWW